jgi:NAD+ synthase (glutamine-hydrolysing)
MHIAKKHIQLSLAQPKTRLGDTKFNYEHHLDAINQAKALGTEVIVFPELSITGYNCQDLFLDESFIQEAQDYSQQLAKAAEDIIVVFGSPILVNKKLLNCAVVAKNQKIKAIVPKINLPDVDQYYESRWFVGANELSSDDLNFNPLLTQDIIDLGYIKIAIEVCYDMWFENSIGKTCATKDVDLIINPSCSSSTFTQIQTRYKLISESISRSQTPYVYSNTLFEDNSYSVFDGHSLITYVDDTGKLKRREYFAPIKNINEINSPIVLTENIPIFENLHSKDFKNEYISSFSDTQTPYIPKENELEYLETTFSLQVRGLTYYLSQIELENLVIGLSGGSDSTLAALVMANAMDALGLSRTNVFAYVMPTKNNSSETMNLARKIATQLGFTLIEKNIDELVSAVQPDDASIAYQNAQARLRTLLLMQKANEVNGLVIGTGDLSEIAMGWNTFTGDHISHYNTNPSLFKTTINLILSTYDEFAVARVVKIDKNILANVVEIPSSPELLSDSTDSVTQMSEEKIGEYIINDYILFNFLKRRPKAETLKQLDKHFGLSEVAAEQVFTEFYERFNRSQWKRDTNVYGAKVTSFSVLGKIDFRYPPNSFFNQS